MKIHTAHNLFHRFLTPILAAAIVAALLLGASAPASASAFNSSKSGIKTLGVVDWSQAGPPGTIIPSGSHFYSSNRLGMTAIMPGTTGKAIMTKGVSGVGPGEPIQAHALRKAVVCVLQLPGQPAVLFY